MSSSEVLDRLDHSLIAALRKDGRAPVAELARELGVTRTTVTKRIERLQEHGVIVGFTVQLGHDAAHDVRAICHLAIEGRTMNAAIATLRGMPAVTGLHATNGEWDLIAELTVPTLADVDHTLGRIREITGVHRSETSLLLRSVLV
ncbi:Lrp/AsnC family transcriptional regulator [Actinomyces howellii]|nr:Lrp/AsnC family transcriptional regulator [Actinomyces howellii]